MTNRLSIALAIEVPSIDINAATRREVSRMAHKWAAPQKPKFIGIERFHSVAVFKYKRRMN